MSKIIILRGNSGSGKSTVAKNLQKKIGRGTLLVSQDYIRREMLWINDTPENQAVDLLKQLVSYGHEKCDFVILEGILYTDYYDSLFKEIEEIFSGRIFAYYFDLPFEETLIRHNQKPNCHEFGENEMRRWWRDKDYLRDIREKTINKDMNLIEIIEFVYQEVIK